MFSIETHERKLFSASKKSIIFNQNIGMENLEELDVNENSNDALTSPKHLEIPVKSTLNDAFFILVSSTFKFRFSHQTATTISNLLFQRIIINDDMQHLMHR